MEKPMNTKYVFEFEDGETCEMTLAFYALLMLKGKNKGLYDRYNKAYSGMADKKKEYDELETLTILYTAYRCANINEPEENLMSETEFIIKCGSDRRALGRAMQRLLNPKKPKAFGNPSSAKQAAESERK
jgi:hypothetical protein